jgi:hypothetical protein
MLSSNLLISVLLHRPRDMVSELCSRYMNSNQMVLFHGVLVSMTRKKIEANINVINPFIDVPTPIPMQHSLPMTLCHYASVGSIDLITLITDMMLVPVSKYSIVSTHWRRYWFIYPKIPLISMNMIYFVFIDPWFTQHDHRQRAKQKFSG